jgi:hypothetical protein
MARNYSSTVEPKTLTANITDPTATTITLNNVTGLPSPPYVLVINPDTAKEEVVLVTVSQAGVTSPTLRVERGIEAKDGVGAARNDHTAGNIVKHMIVGSDLQIVHDHIDDSAIVHGIASGEGDVVGTLKAQTLTNKTLTTPKINENVNLTANSTELNKLDGATVSTAELNVLSGITASTAELNIMDGVTSTAAELNILDGATVTAAELNILDGVTASTAELNGLSGRTASRAIVTNASGILTAAVTTDTEIARLSGLSSNVQDQLNSKAPTANPTFTGTITGNVSGNVTGSSGSCTGNAATSSSTTGNAATATRLQTARTINDVSFNGTANIKTHAGGAGSATSTGSFDRVYHGLGVTPTSVTCTQRSSTGTTGSPRIFYVTTINSSYFDVYSLNTSGAAADGAFYWIAVV